MRQSHVAAGRTFLGYAVTALEVIDASTGPRDAADVAFRLTPLRLCPRRPAAARMLNRGAWDAQRSRA
jgi:hypothetical protein